MARSIAGIMAGASVEGLNLPGVARLINRLCDQVQGGADNALVAPREPLKETLPNFLARTADDACTSPHSEHEACDETWPDEPSRWCLVCLATQVLLWKGQEVERYLTLKAAESAALVAGLRQELAEIRRARIGDAEIIGRWQCEAQAETARADEAEHMIRSQELALVCPHAETECQFRGGGAGSCIRTSSGATFNMQCYQAWLKHQKSLVAAEAEVAGLRQDLQEAREDLESQAWPRVLNVGVRLLEKFYPADIFTGVSGDPGPTYVVALRDALKRQSDAEGVLAGLRALIAQWQAYQAEWQKKLKDVELSPAFVQGVQSTWQIAADELDALLEPGRPARSQEETNGGK